MQGKKKNNKKHCLILSLPLSHPLHFYSCFQKVCDWLPPMKELRISQWFLSKSVQTPQGKYNQNQGCDHLLFTLFALPCSIGYCLLLQSKLPWVKIGLFLTLSLFVWEIYLLSLLSIVTGGRHWASRFKLVSFTPLPGSATCWVASFTSPWDYLGSFFLSDVQTESWGDKIWAQSLQTSYTFKVIWWRGAMVPYGWVGTKWHLSKDMHPE